MKNISFVITTIILIIVLIIGGTFIKVQSDHSRKSFEVLEKRITEAALQCRWDDVCTEDKITLSFLIEKGYAKEEVNPETKMYYSMDSYVTYDKDHFVFTGL